MFCPNCGSANEEGAKFCDNCGREIFYRQSGGSSGSRAFRGGASESAFKGFFILIAAYFTMPIKTIRLTFSELRDVGSGEKFDLEATELPHLTWMTVAGHLVTTMVLFIITFLTTIYTLKNFYNIFNPSSSFFGAADSLSTRIITFLGTPITGALLAVAANWILMMSLELLTILIGIANNVKKVAHK
jgi:hypothetical protein